jgi:hypothetical protein
MMALTDWRVGSIWMLAGSPRCSPFSTIAKTFPQKSHELIAER